jgi:phosphatidylglycerophosphate synthase
MVAILADFLTLVRIPLGFAVVYAGATSGGAALPHVVWISLAAWTADTLDGHLKRASSAKPGWVGRLDLALDVFFNACVAVFLTLAGFISAWLLSAWLGALGFLGIKARSRSGVIATEGVAILVLLIQAFQRALALGGAMVGWGVLTLALDRNRFAYRLSKFLQGLPFRRESRHRKEEEA